MSKEELDIYVLELYSGIGGMHYSLFNLKNAEVIAAVDISPLANLVYHHNFPKTKHIETGIEGLSKKQLEKMKFNMLLMSPPCQPFTRLGLKKDKNDPRTKSFFYFLNLLKEMKCPPTYILLENVKGFEESETFKIFRDVLSGLSYNQQGFLISPKDFGIPNSRLRYYHLAIRKPLSFNPKWHKPNHVLDFLPYSVDKQSHLINLNSAVLAQKQTIPCESLTSYLDEADPELSQYGLPKEIVQRYINVMDVVTPDSAISTCFTKSYGHYFEGTGSVLNILANNGNEKDFSDVKNIQNPFLRYFTPREIANLMGFPKSTFTFPDSTTIKQRYRLLGNSLNVHVVSQLINLLVNDVYFDQYCNKSN